MIIPCFVLFCAQASQPHASAPGGMEARIEAIIRKMTLAEKLGQMSQTGMPDKVTPQMRDALLHGRYGSLYGGGNPAARAEVQRLSRQSRLGIPLIIGADVIHGLKTGFPIPLGQAASWDPQLVQACARIAGRESAEDGIRWTFSPMMDIARDPRWGRIAEGYGEDPFLASAMGAATVRGYQGSSLANPDSIAACGKHYVGYGAAEAGRDYNSTWIPENLLRDVYLKPFEAAKKAGIASYMSSFNAINGVPATGNPLTLRQILRDEWGFDGFVVSDYDAVDEMIAHGFARDGAEAAEKAIKAGVDMEMVGEDYYRYGPALVASKRLDIKTIDTAVRNILRVKLRLGLFDAKTQAASAASQGPTAQTLAVSRTLAEESLVLLKNKNACLPLRADPGTVAVIGPLADSKDDQLGTWASASPSTSITPLESLREKLGADHVLYAKGVSLDFGWDDEEERKVLTGKNRDGFAAAIDAGKRADTILLFLGETNSMSGEASSRSNLDLPGAQGELVEELAKLGKPMVLVIMAGRPLIFQAAAAASHAVLYAWAPGPMAGPAIVDTLFGASVPSGKLPVSFPRSVGQVPIYYDHLSTGRPASETKHDHFTSRYLDIPFTPEYPFGYGLSYTTFRYSQPRASSPRMAVDGRITVSCEVTNTGSVAADEVAQFYTHQKFASVARPVRELKGFRRIFLRPGETQTVAFSLSASDLAFFNARMKEVVEPGDFEAWISPDSVSGVPVSFQVSPRK